jgi:hypothetical protein
MSAEKCWIYKCNSLNQPHQIAHGDWEKFFSSGQAKEWGSTKWLPKLAVLNEGDTILAYQTDRNELVGLARVLRWQRRGPFQQVILKPVERIGTKVRPLKQADARIANIGALQPGPIKTIYYITAVDARRLVNAASTQKRRNRS